MAPDELQIPDSFIDDLMGELSNNSNLNNGYISNQSDNLIHEQNISWITAPNSQNEVSHQIQSINSINLIDNNNLNQNQNLNYQQQNFNNKQTIFLTDYVNELNMNKNMTLNQSNINECIYNIDNYGNSSNNINNNNLNLNNHQYHNIMTNLQSGVHGSLSDNSLLTSYGLSNIETKINQNMDQIKKPRKNLKDILKGDSTPSNFNPNNFTLKHNHSIPIINTKEDNRNLKQNFNFGMANENVTSQTLKPKSRSIHSIMNNGFTSMTNRSNEIITINNILGSPPNYQMQITPSSPPLTHSPPHSSPTHQHFHHQQIPLAQLISDSGNQHYFLEQNMVHF